jgi:hypothetical protein
MILQGIFQGQQIEGRRRDDDLCARRSLICLELDGETELTDARIELSIVQIVHELDQAGMGAIPGASRVNRISLQSGFLHFAALKESVLE